MLNALIDFSLKNRFVVLLLAGILVVLGVRSAMRLPLDAFPDTTPVQVQINTVAPALVARGGRAADHLPGRAGARRPARGSRSSARSRSSASRRSSSSSRTAPTSTSPASWSTSGSARSSSREGIERPTMGPVATGLGEVFHYVVTSENPEYDLTELRTIQDWVIRPAAPARAGRRRGQHLGRAREAVPGPGRPREARQVRPDARRPGASPPGRTTRTSAAATSSARASRASSRGSAASAPSTRSPRSSSRRTTACPIRVRDVAEVARRPRDPPRRRHRRRQGRGRPRPRLHAHGREHAARSPGPSTRAMRRRQEGPARPASTVDAGLRPHRPGRPGPRHGRAEPLRGRRSSSSPCSSPSSATSGPG